jgi:O-antigen ligase
MFPTRWERVGARPIVETMGLLGLALMAISLGISNTGQSIGMALMIIASVLAWRRLWVGLKEDWVARFVLIWFCLVVLRMLWAIWEMPELMPSHVDFTRVVARIFMFPLTCWWLGGEDRALRSVCVLVLCGAIANIFYYGDWTQLDSLSVSQRLWFGGDPRLEGLLYVSILAGMIAFARPWWGRASNKPIFLVRLLLWLMLYLLVLWALVAVQARAAWIAGTITGVIFLGRSVHAALRSRSGGGMRRGLALALILLVGTSTVLTAFADRISYRLWQQHETYELLLQGDLDEIQDPSIATRAYLIGVGWSAWLERPLVGWGPGISKHLIAQADIPPVFRGNSELHNNYLDVLVRFGVIGALLFFGFWLRLLLRYAQNLRAGEIPADMGGFVLSLSLMFFIVNFTDTYIDFQFGWFYMMFLCALLHNPLMRPAIGQYNPEHGRMMSNPVGDS